MRETHFNLSEIEKPLLSNLVKHWNLKYMKSYETKDSKCTWKWELPSELP